MTAEELAAVVLDQAERDGISREELALRILGGPQDARAQFWLVSHDWTAAEMEGAARAIADVRRMSHGLGLPTMPFATGAELDALAGMHGEYRYLETDDELREYLRSSNPERLEPHE